MSTCASALAPRSAAAQSSAFAAAVALSVSASAPAPPSAAASSRCCRSVCAASSVAVSEAILVWSSLFCDALHRQQAGQLLDLAVELGERGVLAGHFARQEELRQHEHRQQEDDDQQHRRQRVDEARPVVHALEAAPVRQRHGLTPCGEGSARLALARQAAQQPADVVLLRRLRVDPIADLLLLRAHVADQRLDALGEARHRRRAAALVVHVRHAAFS